MHRALILSCLVLAPTAGRADTDGEYVWRCDSTAERIELRETRQGDYDLVVRRVQSEGVARILMSGLTCTFSSSDPLVYWCEPSDGEDFVRAISIRRHSVMPRTGGARETHTAVVELQMVVDGEARNRTFEGTACGTQRLPPRPPARLGVGEACGGETRELRVCAEGLYCHFTDEAICGAADAPGTCAEPPSGCTDDWDPVCGCDGRIHSNRCYAAAAKTSVAPREWCRGSE